MGNQSLMTKRKIKINNIFKSNQNNMVDCNLNVNNEMEIKMVRT